MGCQVFRESPSELLLADLAVAVSIDSDVDLGSSVNNLLRGLALDGELTEIKALFLSHLLEHSIGDYDALGRRAMFVDVLLEASPELLLGELAVAVCIELDALFLGVGNELRSGVAFHRERADVDLEHGSAVLEHLFGDLNRLLASGAGGRVGGRSGVSSSGSSGVGGSGGGGGASGSGISELDTGSDSDEKSDLEDLHSELILEACFCLIVKSSLELRPLYSPVFARFNSPCAKSSADLPGLYRLCMNIIFIKTC